MIRNYEQQVYAGVLGKVVGVYMGRPIENWTRDKIEALWGRVDRYLHEDRGLPLVVADDDISGTLTFPRALEDSGRYAETTAEDFGDAWLNYLIPHQTVLWWGGMGLSTEHTAYRRLQQGLKPPLSGAIATNGRQVAEQIGAQIFIDGFGLVAPGRPELAAALARRAASVSHDGEAAHAAAVVAGMIAAAFVEKDMDRLFEAGARLIPAESVIAQVHREVRAWAARGGDWRGTWERIEARYGVARFGGSCHVVPNHAMMVMAWAHAPEDFHESQAIINTAGRDTDCNAANVGALMGVKLGLRRINESYDFQGPFADRILVPTAEGTRGVSDVLSEAMHLARIGRAVMGWRPLPPPKGGAWHHFDQPGARHGYQAETAPFECRGAAETENVAGRSATGRRSLRFGFRVGPGRVARVSTPVLPRPDAESGASYGVTATPRLYPGNTVTVGASVGGLNGPATARIFVRHAAPEGSAAPAPATVLTRGPGVRLKAGRAATLTLTVPDLPAGPVLDLGLEVTGPRPARGDLFVDRVALGGRVRLAPAGARLPMAGAAVPGWIRHMDSVFVPRGDSAACPGSFVTLTRNEGRGVLVTGTTDWRDLRVEARIAVPLADQAGLLFGYRGLQRYVAAVKTPDRLRLVWRDSGDRVLDERPCRWEADEPHAIRLEARGGRVSVRCDGREVLRGEAGDCVRGGAGFLVETGTLLFRDFSVESRAAGPGPGG